MRDSHPFDDYSRLKRDRNPRDETTTAARQRLTETPYESLQQVSCEEQDGVLVLHGRVPSFYLKQLAQELVRPIEGVKTISNRLQVDVRGEGGRI